MHWRVNGCRGFCWLLAGAALLSAGCGEGANRQAEQPWKAQTAEEPVRKSLEKPLQEPRELVAEPSPPATDSTDLAHSDHATAPALEVPTEPEAPTGPERPLTPSEAPPPPPLPASQAPLPLDGTPTEQLEMPRVVLTKHHAELNKVGVGDAFPNLELPNLNGEQRALAGLLGPKLTLVVFWNALQPTSLEEISDLARYHQPRFADKGLAIVAVNTGDSTQLAGELVAKAGATYSVLSDADGAALKQVAAGKLPRTYLLDPAGKILWFDMEYSPTTRRDLAAAIRKSLGTP